MHIPRKFATWMLVLHLFLFSFCNALAQTGSITEWLLLGPIPVTEDTSKVNDAEEKEAFATDYINPAELGEIKDGQIQTIQGQEIKWKKAQENENLVNLDNIFDGPDFVSAYAWAEIDMPEAKSVLLGVGSDDGVKVWVNGELVHENWILRGLVLDDDIVPVELQQGKNQILLKVQDQRQGWSFSCRILPPEKYTEKLNEAAGGGQTDDVKLFLSHGVDINAKNDLGLTALHVAKINGRQDMVETLIGQGANPDIPMPAKGEVTDALFEKAVGEHEPGASVLVARDGEILYEKGFGFANLKKDIPITPETEFRIGSITKQFTASAILKLQEEGKLSVEDKLSKYVPGYPRGDEVTIHHLLTHTSGIKNYTDKIKFDDEEVTKPIASVEKHIESFKKDPYDFDPGEVWSYSNSGYFLLGYIVEKVSGMPFGEYLQQKFFTPLGMDHTGLHHKGIKLEHEALGYSFESGKAELAPNWEMTWAGGAGALYSTVGDLYKWNEAVFNGKVLKEESLKTAFTPVTLNNGKEAQPNYGYGWMLGEFRGLKEVQHGGGLPGFVTYLTRFPEQNITVTVLTNALPPRELNPERAAHDIAKIFFWEDMETQASYTTSESADPGLYKDYVGRYEYPRGVILAVRTEDDKLFAQSSGQPEFEIFPRGNEEFFWKVVDAQVKFERDEAGKVTHAVHTQGGQTFEAPRMEEETIAEIDTSVLKNYVGEYDLNGTSVNIMEQDAKLFIQVTGQPQFEMFPRSETEFFLKAVKADLTFVKNETGEVNEMILEQGGRKFTLLRKK